MARIEVNPAAEKRRYAALENATKALQPDDVVLSAEVVLAEPKQKAAVRGRLLAFQHLIAAKHAVIGRPSYQDGEDMIITR